ncbi:MAG: hypothetical protein KGK00_05495, partial [Paracoccaceae bacterium]|nr:hypothetical protein [Paracoccaceae bacterium]
HFTVPVGMPFLLYQTSRRGTAPGRAAILPSHSGCLSQEAVDEKAVVTRSECRIEKKNQDM